MILIDGLLERKSALEVIVRGKTWKDEFVVDESQCTTTFKAVGSRANFVNALIFGLHVNFNADIVEAKGAKNQFNVGERQKINGFKFV